MHLNVYLSKVNYIYSVEKQNHIADHYESIPSVEINRMHSSLRMNIRNSQWNDQI